MNLERLDKAFAVYDLPVLVAAARAYRELLANGERVWWCETHDWPPYRDKRRRHDVCLYMTDGNNPDCRIVSKLLVDPTTEEER